MFPLSGLCVRAPRLRPTVFADNDMTSRGRRSHVELKKHVIRKRMCKIELEVVHLLHRRHELDQELLVLAQMLRAAGDNS